MPNPPDFDAFRNRTPVSTPQPTQPRPQPTASIAQLPGENRLPLAAGTSLRLTPYERDGLAKLGWVEGQPVPANLANVIKAEVDAANNIQGIWPVAADFQAPPMNPVDFESLPDQHRANLAQWFQEQAKAPRPLTQLDGSPHKPGVAEALALAGSMPARHAAPPPTIDQVRAGLRAAASPIPVARPVGDWQEGPARGEAVPPVNPIGQAVEQRQQAQATAVVAPEPTPEPAPAPATGSVLSDCKHCGWPADRPSEIDPTPADKYGFLAMVLGGAGRRFYKDVSLFGGAVTVSFRTLTPREANMAWEQIAHDTRAGRQETGYDRLRLIQEYRLAMSLSAIETVGAGIVQVPEAGTLPPRADGPFARETALPELVEWIDQALLPNEQVKIAVLKACTQFQLLCDKLEANTQNQDFWEGIAAPR